MALTSISKFTVNYRYCVLSKFGLSEPANAKKPGWGDMAVEQTYEVLKRGSQFAFRFLRELLLVHDGDYMYNCYVAALEQCAVYLDKAAQDFLREKGETYEKYATLPPSGSLLLQIRVLVPKHRQGKVPTEVLLFVNNETKSSRELRAVQATGPQMFVQLAHAIALLVKEARGELNKDVAMPPAVDGKLITEK